MRALKKTNRFNRQNSNFACASHTLCLFLCSFAQQCHEKKPNFVFYGECKQATTKFYFFSELGYDF